MGIMKEEWFDEENEELSVMMWWPATGCDPMLLTGIVWV
jgi:hypothetical protein